MQKWCCNKLNSTKDTYLTIFGELSYQLFAMLSKSSLLINLLIDKLITHYYSWKSTILRQLTLPYYKSYEI
jgi:hypothetical protein